MLSPQEMWNWCLHTLECDPNGMALLLPQAGHSFILHTFPIPGSAPALLKKPQLEPSRYDVEQEA